MDAAPASVSHALALFPLPVLLTEITEATALNTALIELVRRLAAEQQGIVRTNVGGWHSEKDLASHPDPALQRFLLLARQALTDWAMQSFELTTAPAPALWQIELWANLNRRGHYNREHDHFRTGILASAFYYVQSGGENVGGRTVFFNQRMAPSFVEMTARWRNSEYALSPRDGTLAVFPSWLAHRVEPYLGERDRITLALNAGHPMLPIKKQGDRPLPPWLKRLLGR